MTKCSTPTCDKNGKMTCPTCKKLGIPLEISLFCSQECFKGYWSTHKSIHKLLSTNVSKSLNDKNPSESLPIHFHGYTFTGDLRPFPLSSTRKIPDHILRPDYAVTGIPISEENASKQIPIYSEKEIIGIRNACRLGREILDIAGNAIKIGITCDEIDAIVHQACIERECYPSPLNYYNFPKSVCTSVNEVICHGIPDKRPLENGDIVNIDVTVYKDGYHGDLNETYLVGNVDIVSIKLVQTAFECLQKTIDLVKPGTMYRDLGNHITSVANAAGFSVVKTYCGHGIGSLFHTSPNVPHYSKNKAIGIMKPGHIFTIEPMINVGNWRDQTWPDNWTSVTIDGKRSAQFEHTILVTETGYEILTARKNEPIMQWDINKVQRGI